VTDLPYGKSSKRSEALLSLYAKFLRNLAGRSVVIMPNFMPYKKLLEKNLPKSLSVIDIIDHYVHKSLTRKIILIDTKDVNRNKITLVKKSKSRVNKIRIKKVHKSSIKHKKVLIKKIIKRNVIKKYVKNKNRNSIKHKTIKKRR
jgi:hypothetical protein